MLTSSARQMSQICCQKPMIENEYITFIKSVIALYFEEYVITAENSNGPHWHLELKILHYQIKIFGDIAFELNIIDKGKELKLALLDRDLVGKQKTTFENIICHLKSLKSFIDDGRL